MGLDNIGPLDRSHLPFRGILEQSDATGWMAGYALSMAHDRGDPARRRGIGPRSILVQKFLEHFAGDRGSPWKPWVFGTSTTECTMTGSCCPTATAVPVRVRSMVAMIPLLAAAIVNEEAIDRTLVTDKLFAEYLRRHGLGGTEEMVAAGILRGDPGRRRLLIGVTGLDRVRRLCQTLFDPGGVPVPARASLVVGAITASIRTIWTCEGVRAGIDYEPAESTTDMFGGNSNWRGPVWFPLNYLVGDRTGALPRILRRRN